MNLPKKVLVSLAKQRNTGPLLGAVKDLASRVMIYLSLLNFVQISATFFTVTLKPNFLQHAPWLNFWIYFGALLLFTTLIMLFEYKLVMPSTFTFINKQEYTHENLIRQDLLEIKTLLAKKICPHCGKEL
jgi:hypothetical protein